VARRGNGEGCISKRKDGTYAAVLSNGRNPSTGKPKRIFLYGKTRAEVADKLAKTLGEMQQGSFVEPNNLTVGGWLDTWLKDYAKPHIRQATWVSYEMLIRVHIKPSIGNIKLRQLQPTHLQELYNEELRNGRADQTGGLSARTVELTHVVVHSALKQAIENGLLVRNASDATKLPRQEKKEMRVLTPDEEKKLLDTLGTDTYSTAILLDLSTGLRLGELLGLRWEDVDLDAGILRVQQSIARLKNDGGTTKTSLVFQPLKTKKSQRSVPIPESVVVTLKTYKARQNREGLVFSTPTGTPIEPRNFIRRFGQLLAKAGIPEANVHAMRHSYATRLFELNEHPKTVQELLGHSQISMTLDTYSHVMPEIKQAAAKKLDGWLSPQKKNPPEGEK
jgi:integrase